MNQFDENITMIYENWVIKLYENVVSSQHGFDLVFGILSNNIVVFRIKDLTLNSKVVFDFW